jgi:DNA-binding XRE family transcriptional regulator
MAENRPLEIKAALIRLGISQVQISRRVGVSPQTVCAVIKGRKTSARVTRALIEAGVPAELFKRLAEV